MARQIEVLGERIARHGLIDRPASTVANAAALTCAIQAQDPQASRLGMRTRAANLTEDDVLAAIADARSVTRTWLMRGTIHLVDTADLRWLVHVIGPSLIRKLRTRWKQLGLTEPVLERTSRLMPEILAGGPRTRAEIRTALTERGAAVESPDPNLYSHVLLHASAIGLVCRGPERGRDVTFTLLDDWVPDSAPGPRDDDALAELARRYFTAFSPATPADFTAWSGLPSSRAITLIRDELTPVDLDGRAGFRLGEMLPQRGVRLLAAFDNYLLGYRHRDAILTESLRPRVYSGGVIYPAVLVTGASSAPGRSNVAGTPPGSPSRRSIG